MHSGAQHVCENCYEDKMNVDRLRFEGVDSRDCSRI
jgi:hypothetical protein